MKKYCFLFCLFLCLGLGAQDSLVLKSKVRHTIDELKEFIAIPNDALNADHITDNLIWLKKKFNARGFNTTELETSNHPLFFAALPMDDNKPTLLLYMHFDGQSVDPSKWGQSNPYKMVLKKPTDGGFEEVPYSELDDDIDYSWRIFGRSTSDDKGPILMLLNTIDILQKEEKELAFNIKVILDGEEERGSKPLPDAVKQYRELLESDFLVINDGPMHASGKPTVVYGCRGITTMSLTTYGPDKPQHSGHYGNYAPNPGFQLAQLLASMKDGNGKVLISGYYNGISIDEKTTEVLKSVPDDATDIANRLQIKNHEKVGSFYQESLQFPSLNIRSLASGWVGKKARTIVPASATAELDLRLVPESNGSKLKQLVKDHIKAQGYTVLDHVPSKAERLENDKIVTVSEGSVTDAFRTDLNNKYGEFLVKTMGQIFKQDVIQIRIMGGTVPIAPFINELKVPAFVVPMVNQDNNQHSPNENLQIGQIAYGIQAFYGLLTATETP